MSLIPLNVLPTFSISKEKNSVYINFCSKNVHDIDLIYIISDTHGVPNQINSFPPLSSPNQRRETMEKNT